MPLVVLLDHLLDFLHRGKGNRFLGAKILTGAAADNAVQRLRHPRAIFLLVPLKNPTLAKIKTLLAADALVLINGGVPGDLFPRNLEHLFLLIFREGFLHHLSLHLWVSGSDDIKAIFLNIIFDEPVPVIDAELGMNNGVLHIHFPTHRVDEFPEIQSFETRTLTRANAHDKRWFFGHSNTSLILERFYGENQTDVMDSLDLAFFALLDGQVGPGHGGIQTVEIPNSRHVSTTFSVVAGGTTVTTTSGFSGRSGKDL
jgi:hypothetical protein